MYLKNKFFIFSVMITLPALYFLITSFNDIVSTEKGFEGGEFKLGIIPTVMPTLLHMFLNTFTKK